MEGYLQDPTFKAGSSKQGKAFLASVDSNWVAAMNFSEPLSSSQAKKTKNNSQLYGENNTV